MDLWNNAIFLLNPTEYLSIPIGFTRCCDSAREKQVSYGMSISCTVRRGSMRNPPRIIANLRESHFSCSALLTFGRVPTLRLIGSAWPGRRNEKCWKTRVAGFLSIFSNPCNKKQISVLSGENPRRGFSSIFHAGVPATRSRSGAA